MRKLRCSRSLSYPPCSTADWRVRPRTWQRCPAMSRLQFIHRCQDPGKLSPDLARKVEIAAAQFKEFWENGCATSANYTTAPAEETLQTPDPVLIALLRAVECDDDNAVLTLANWLEKCGDPRAGTMKEITRIEVVVTETWREANKIICVCEGTYSRLVADTEEALAQQVQELRRRHRSQEVWKRLGVSLVRGILSSCTLASTQRVSPRPSRKSHSCRGSKCRLSRFRFGPSSNRVRGTIARPLLIMTCTTKLIPGEGHATRCSIPSTPATSMPTPRS